MKYLVKYIADKKIVHIKMTGRINFQIAEKYSKEAISLARRNGCSKFLINHKDTSILSTFTNLFTAGSELQQFGFRNSDKVAILIKKIGKNKYSRNSQVGNISWSNSKYFDSNKLEDALIWLSN